MVMPPMLLLENNIVFVTKNLLFWLNPNPQRKRLLKFELN